MTNYMDPIVDGDFRVRVVFDEDHETRGSYGYETEEETRAAEDEEIEKLESGEWVVLGFIIEQRCPRCKSWDTPEDSRQDISVWGVVIDNSEKAVREALIADGFLTADGKIPAAQECKVAQ